MKSEILQSIDWQNKFEYWNQTGKPWVKLIEEPHFHSLAKGGTCKICGYTNKGYRPDLYEARQTVWEENHTEEIEDERKI